MKKITNNFKYILRHKEYMDSEREDCYFSVVDVIGTLTDNKYQKSRNYWKWFKRKLNNEGSELVSNTTRLKKKV